MHSKCIVRRMSVFRSRRRSAGHLRPDRAEESDGVVTMHIVYLDVLTAHYWKNEVGGRYARTNLRLTNADSGSTTTMRYPDPE